ncbi:hypothetical protein [Zobellella maritima]|uniref:hypothetical protein n=1 Tax=Zobellella maritima TaxID=2059725 RepID=UPI000E30B258|nr:hypothetical protein [Zobellella maritima]
MSPRRGVLQERGFLPFLIARSVAVWDGIATRAVAGAWMWGFKTLRRVDRFSEVEALASR